MSRIPEGGLRELGAITWVIGRIAARALRTPTMHLFTTLGQHRRLFWAVLFTGAALSNGRLPRQDTELVILRVAHLRKCEYELQHHRAMARRHGVDTDMQQKIFAWPHSHGLTPRRQALLTATDEFVLLRTLSDDSWTALSRYLDRRQLIEFCLLAGQYDAMAATMSALDIPLDHEQPSAEADAGPASTARPPSPLDEEAAVKGNR